MHAIPVAGRNASDLAESGRCLPVGADVCLFPVMWQTLSVIIFAWQVQDSAHGGVEMANGAHKV